MGLQLPFEVSAAHDDRAGIALNRRHGLEGKGAAISAGVLVSTAHATFWVVGHGLPLHKRHPVRIHTLPGLVSKEWLLVSQSQYLADLHLGFVPLEDQHAIGGQHAEALSKALGQVVAPVIGEYSVLRSKPAITTCAGQMWRTEDDHLDGAVFEGQDCDSP